MKVISQVMSYVNFFFLIFLNYMAIGVVMKTLL